MVHKLFNASVASTIVVGYYQIIINMVAMNREDTPEYHELVNKLKDYVQFERDYYLGLDDKAIEVYFNRIKHKTSFCNPIDGRIYMRMCDVQKIYDGNPVIDGDILLSTIISGKVIIDILKNVEDKIRQILASDTMDENDKVFLELYGKHYKMHYLSSNVFTERLALDNEFDITKIPSYSYHDIEDQFKVKFIDNIQNNFYDYIVASLDELADLHSDDQYLLLYTKLFETARIESMLPYLNIDSLNRLISYIGKHHIKYDSNSALTNIKKIIKKRREEFNK